MQKLRAAVYLQDGAIQKNHLSDGRHRQAHDEGSWHLLVLDDAGGVCGCARYREYLNNTQFSNLGVSRSALAKCSQWGHRLRSSVEAELALSRQMALPYVELGGWALLDQIRGTTEAIRMALLTYGLSQALGGGVGISTATYRNGSASILRRIGGQSLTHATRELPTYHDPQYECEMEVLRFYSWAPNPRYAPWISDLKATLLEIPIMTNGVSDPSWKFRRDFIPNNGWRDSTVPAENSRSSFV